MSVREITCKLRAWEAGAPLPRYSTIHHAIVPEDRALRNFDLARGTVRWEPSQVVYADGTSIEVGQ